MDLAPIVKSRNNLHQQWDVPPGRLSSICNLPSGKPPLIAFWNLPLWMTLPSESFYLLWMSISMKNILLTRTAQCIWSRMEASTVSVIYLSEIEALITVTLSYFDERWSQLAIINWPVKCYTIKNSRKTNG